MTRLTKAALQFAIGVVSDGVWGPRSAAALNARLSRPNAPRLTDADFKAAAARLGVPVGYIRGSRKIEAPRGPYDALGRPNILFERHKFRNNSDPVGQFNASAPDLSGGPYGPGGYGSFDSQYEKLNRAIALDPHAALSACSWGAFQVLGENAVALGYASALDMVLSLTTGEAAHLETYVRFVERNGLVKKLQACKPHDPVSCRPFVSVYNGAGFRLFHYDTLFAEAIA